MAYQVSTLQSLLQLSVALNLGFLGYLSLAGDRLKREEALVNDLVLLSEALHLKIADDIAHKSEAEKILSSALHLKKKYKNSEIKMDAAARGWPRIIILISAILSFAGLIYASLVDVELDFTAAVLTLILYIPFFSVIVSNQISSYRISREIGSEREKLDSELLAFKLSIAERS